MKAKRIFLIVLDSVGIGALPDAIDYGDEGSNTLKVCYDTGLLKVDNLRNMGIFNIDGNSYGKAVDVPIASFARTKEKSKGKDTTIGHWEICGIVSEKALPTYPNGFSQEIISEFEMVTGRKTLCNKPYSGTDVIRDYGEQHIKTGALIVYTSADSVFQIAAHEDIVHVEELYEHCETARKILSGENGVGRVIARPFTGNFPFQRTSNRHDFSLKPPSETALDIIKEAGLDVISVGKIYDIFAGCGITQSIRTKNNVMGMNETISLAKTDFNGLCFVNLVDFDMIYGHRNDVFGYTNALNEFDLQLAELLKLLKEDDVLIITADHGCDPVTPSTDHSREYTPLLVYGKSISQNVNLGTLESFSDIGATVLDFLGIKGDIKGKSFKKLIT